MGWPSCEAGRWCFQIRVCLPLSFVLFHVKMPENPVSFLVYLMTEQSRLTTLSSRISLTFISRWPNLFVLMLQVGLWLDGNLFPNRSFTTPAPQSHAIPQPPQGVLVFKSGSGKTSSSCTSGNSHSLGYKIFRAFITPSRPPVSQWSESHVQDNDSSS